MKDEKEELDVEKVKEDFRKAGCPGVVKLIDWLQKEEKAGLWYIVLCYDPFKITKLPFTPENALLLGKTRIKIGSKNQSPTAHMATLIPKIYEVPAEALVIFNAGCRDSVESNEEIKWRRTRAFFLGLVEAIFPRLLIMWRRWKGGNRSLRCYVTMPLP